MLPVNPECPEYPLEPDGMLPGLPPSGYLLNFRMPSEMFQQLPYKPKRKIFHTANRDIKDGMDEMWGRQQKKDSLEAEKPRKVDHKGEILIQLDYPK